MYRLAPRGGRVRREQGSNARRTARRAGNHPRRADRGRGYGDARAPARQEARSVCPARRRHRTQPDLYEISEEHPSELQSLMRISYAVFYWKKKFNKHAMIA